MRERIPVEYGIGFADSEIISYESKNDTTYVYLLAWNGITLRFEFIESVFFAIYCNWYISDVCKTNDSDFLKQAIKIASGDSTDEHQYKIYQFLDLDDEIAAEVICKELIISQKEL